MFLWSTVDRKRGTTELWLVGNSITRVCPYIRGWGLEKIFKTIKQGEIMTKTIKNDDTEIKIAVEYCRSSGGKSMSIGTSASSIDKGSWQTFPQPKLQKSKKCYNILYRIGFLYKGFKFIGELLQDKITNEICWFIFPFYKEFSDRLIIFSDEIKQSIYYQRDIYSLNNINIKNERIRRLLYNTFREDKIFFSDDLCGTDFKQVIDFMIKR